MRLNSLEISIHWTHASNQRSLYVAWWTYGEEDAEPFFPPRNKTLALVELVGMVDRVSHRLQFMQTSAPGLSDKNARTHSHGKNRDEDHVGVAAGRHDTDLNHRQEVCLTCKGLKRVCEKKVETEGSKLELLCT